MGEFRRQLQTLSCPEVTQGRAPGWCAPNPMLFVSTVMRAVAAGQSPVVDLVEGLRRGNPDAIAEVYDEHHEAIRAFASRKSRGTSKAALGQRAWRGRLHRPPRRQRGH